jgi:hypothetical protein
MRTAPEMNGGRTSRSKEQGGQCGYPLDDLHRRAEQVRDLLSPIFAEMPWLAIWVRPRAAIQRILNSHLRNYTLSLAWLTWTLTFYDIFLIVRWQLPERFPESARVSWPAVALGPPVLGLAFVGLLFYGRSR